MTRSIASNGPEMTQSLAFFAGCQLRLSTRRHHHGYGAWQRHQGFPADTGDDCTDLRNL